MILVLYCRYRNVVVYSILIVLYVLYLVDFCRYFTKIDRKSSKNRSKTPKQIHRPSLH